MLPRKMEHNNWSKVLFWYHAFVSKYYMIMESHILEYQKFFTKNSICCHTIRVCFGHKIAFSTSGFSYPSTWGCNLSNNIFMQILQMWVLADSSNVSRIYDLSWRNVNRYREGRCCDEMSSTKDGIWDSEFPGNGRVLHAFIKDFSKFSYPKT